MTDGNTYAINKRLDELEDFDALQEVTAELEQAEARIEELELAVRYEADLAQMALDARKELEAKLAKAESIVAAAEEMYETEMLTGGGSPLVWADHVKARNAFASNLAELSITTKGQNDD